jgi:hypothetical protein
MRIIKGLIAIAVLVPIVISGFILAACGNEIFRVRKKKNNDGV